jgi:hypothetical protein
MKKRLEAELISIAHRVLKLKNRSEVDQLYKETQKLYETLTVMKFYQDQFEWVKEEVDSVDFEAKLELAFEANETVEDKVAVDTVLINAVAEVEEAIAEVLVSEVAEEVEMEDIETQEPESIEEIVQEEEISEIEETTAADESFEDNDVNQEEDQESHEDDTIPLAFQPIFGLEEESESPVEEESKAETPEPVFETFLGESYVDPVFVKPNEVSLFSTPEVTESETSSPVKTDLHSKSIAIGLNDRIGFVQHLFGDSNEDFNRVLSQLNSFDTYQEAKHFIEDMVKPDYNNWEGEEDYAERFLELVAHKFNA